MTPEEFRERMKELSDKAEDPGQRMGAHEEADDLMCDILEEFGYGEGVAIFKEMYIWYS